MPYVLSEIEDQRRHLIDLLKEDICRIDLTKTAEIDTAGAQLIAAAIRSARAGGKDVVLEMAPGSQPEALWRRLAFDRLCQPQISE